jgi:uncharacterized membrane protein SpoIIM required for sporulation
MRLLTTTPHSVLVSSTPFHHRMQRLISPAVIAASVLFLITITGYKYYVRYQNKLLSGTPEQVKKAMRFGITQEQVDMGWRYEGF